MKYSVAAVLVAAAGASAHYGNNATVTTITTDKIVTYCPGPTQITHGDKTYTVTEAGTITITDCPCTITKPVTTSTEVACETCVEKPTEVVPPAETPVGEKPTGEKPTGEAPPASTGGVSPAPPAETPEVPTAGAATLSGAGLAGLLGLAAFVL